MGMSIDEAIERYKNNAEYERTHGNLQGCLDFRQLIEWLKDYKQLLNAIEDIKLDIQEYREQCDNETWSYYIEGKKEAYTDVLVLIDKHTNTQAEKRTYDK